MARGPLRLTRAGAPAPLASPGPGTLDYALRGVRGGKQRVMELAPLAVRFESRLECVVALWQQFTPWQKRTTTLDELAALGELTTSEFLAAIVRAGFEFNNQITPLLVAAAFPEVIDRGIKRALQLDGFEDRQLLMQYVAAVSNAQRKAVS
jgi:chemotaxis regulatin CheY-phosphate phosphatase CheZ